MMRHFPRLSVQALTRNSVEERNTYGTKEHKQANQTGRAQNRNQNGKPDSNNVRTERRVRTEESGARIAEGWTGSAGAISSLPVPISDSPVWTPEDNEMVCHLAKIVVSLGGGVFKSLWNPDQGRLAILVLFDSPRTKTTLAVKLSDLSAENVRKQLRESDAQFMRGVA